MLLTMVFLLINSNIFTNNFTNYTLIPRYSNSNILYQYKNTTNNCLSNCLASQYCSGIVLNKYNCTGIIYGNYSYTNSNNSYFLKKNNNTNHHKNNKKALSKSDIFLISLGAISLSIFIGGAIYVKYNYDQTTFYDYIKVAVNPTTTSNV
jgi:hypothetical protein